MFSAIIRFSLLIMKKITSMSICLFIVCLVYSLSEAEKKEDFTDMKFGSQKILEACWTDKELQGSPDDKKIKKLKISDNTPPLKISPDFRLPLLVKERKNSIRCVKPYNNLKIIALTFDLCEAANEVSGYDSEIVNYLRTNKIRATFFAGGKWMRSHPEKSMQIMADPLFEIGNHSWSHRNLRILKEKEIEEQILFTQSQYELLRGELMKRICMKNSDLSETEKIPKMIMIFRFPYGTCSSVALNILAKHGLSAVQWDVVTGDPSPKQSDKEISRIVLSQTKPGSIIVCHANGRGYGTAEALPVFIPELKERGFTFVTVSELICMGEIVSAEECYELKPGDNLRYDKKAGAEK